MGGFGSQVVRTSQDITPPPTSDLYGQDVISNQTSFVQEAKGLSPQKPTQVPSELKPATQSEVIASRQTFAPGTEADMIGEDAVQKAIAFRKSKAYDVMQGQYPGLRDTDTEMLGGSETVSAPPVSSANVEVLGNSETVSAPQPKLADLFESQLRGMAQSDARLYRNAGERIGSMRQILNEAGGAPQGASQESQPKIAPAVGPSPEEIRDLDKTLLLAHGATTNRIQREAMRDEMLSKKYGGQAESAPEYVGTGQTIQPVVSSPEAKDFAQSYGKNLMSKTFSPEESSAISHINASQPGVLSVHYQANPEKSYDYNVASPLQMEVGESLFRGEDLGSLGKLVHTSKKLGLLRGA